MTWLTYFGGFWEGFWPRWRHRGHTDNWGK